jgi:hypothetical protein
MAGRHDCRCGRLPKIVAGNDVMNDNMFEVRESLEGAGISVTGTLLC